MGGSLTTTSAGLNEAADWTRSYGEDDIGLYIFLVNDGGGTGIAGMAYVGTVCRDRVKTSINRGPNMGVITMAQILSHELGHNLGMNHDFSGSFGGGRSRNANDGSTVNSTQC